MVYLRTIFTSGMLATGKNMKAIGYKKPLPIDESESLLDIEIAQPEAAGHDLLVEVKAVSVNPVDVKVRARSKPEGSECKILGWDAAGIVRAAGSEVTLLIQATRSTMQARLHAQEATANCIW
jgi:NADPH:quinone reductase-like Zn-dependent oxidoreductase